MIKNLKNYLLKSPLRKLIFEFMKRKIFDNFIDKKKFWIILYQYVDNF